MGARFGLGFYTGWSSVATRLQIRWVRSAVHQVHVMTRLLSWHGLVDKSLPHSVLAFGWIPVCDGLLLIISYCIVRIPFVGLDSNRG